MSNKITFSKRHFLKLSAGASLFALSACASETTRFKKTKPVKPLSKKMSLADAQTISHYGARPSEKFPIPAVDLKRVPSKFYRQRVDYRTSEKVGTIIVDTKNFFLYLVEPKGKAMRYGVGLGRAGFEWSGRAHVSWKRAWPTWTPPAEMIAREPELEKYSAANGGMEPGLENPLGSRALYIFQGNVDTLYRIHGSPEYWTIGKAVSSGCVRMINQDVIDLYNRVPKKARIVVI